MGGVRRSIVSPGPRSTWLTRRTVSRSRTSCSGVMCSWGSPAVSARSSAALRPESSASVRFVSVYCPRWLSLGAEKPCFDASAMRSIHPSSERLSPSVFVTIWYPMTPMLAGSLADGPGRAAAPVPMPIPLDRCPRGTYHLFWGRRSLFTSPLTFSGHFPCIQRREDGPGRAHSPGPDELVSATDPCYFVATTLAIG